jgi:predicted DNA-binding transcriptional regulator AlpA
MAARDVRTRTQPRRGLRREEAAIYVGISPRKFDQMVMDGRMPKPKHIDGARVWDLGLLDMHFSGLPEEGSPAAARDEWGMS